MQSTDLEEIKAALWEQASHPCTQVSWGVAQVMAVRKKPFSLAPLLLLPLPRMACEATLEAYDRFLHES
jgi:hypothetical protein